MRVDLQLSGALLALAISTAVHGQSFSFTPAATGSTATQGAATPPPASPAMQAKPEKGLPAPTTVVAASAPAPTASQPSTIVATNQDLSATPDIAAMIATMSTKAPTVATLAEVARREREIALAERYAKIKAATAPRVPVDAVPQVKVIKPVRQPLVAPESPLKRVLAVYGSPGREEADLMLADGSIQTVQRGTRGDNFEVLSVSRDSVRVLVSRQVVAKGTDHKRRIREVLKTVRSTMDVPVGTAFH